jgi:membrane protein
MKLPGGGQIGLVPFLKRLYCEYEKDAVSDTAAQLSYYFLFALFPFLAFLAALTAYLPLQQYVEELLARMRPLVPGQAMRLIDEHLRALVSQERPRLLTFALLGTIWSASRGVDAVRRALNLAYDVKESRPFWRTQLNSVGMTLIGAILVPVAIAVLAAGGDAGWWLASKIRLEDEFVWAMSWLRWPITVFVIMLAAACTYYFLPDVKQEFKFITPGSIVATTLWMAATWGFGKYVGSFGSYDVTYGSLGAVMILLMWMYISGFIFIMGGEVNAILEHASHTGKEAGARTPDQAPPPPEERPSAMPPGAVKDAEVAKQVERDVRTGESGKGSPDARTGIPAASRSPAR